MDNQTANIDQEKIKLRTKLEEVSVLLKKLNTEFENLEAEKRISLIEPQISSKLLSLSNELETLESIDGKDGDIFVFFLKNLVDIIKEIGNMPMWKRDPHPLEDFIRLLSIIRSLEAEAKDFLPIVLQIDEKRKEAKYETFGGLLQKLIDALEEKRHMILGNVDEQIGDKVE